MTATDASTSETPAELSDTGTTTSTVSVRRTGRMRLPDAILAVVLAASTALYLALARTLWFFGDDWDFLLRRGTVPGADLGLLHPHNEHWSTGPILIFRALFDVFGLRHYLPYALPVLFAHAMVVVLTYVLLVRFGIRRWISLAVVTVLAFNGAGAENTLWDFQVGFVGSVALGLAGLWLYDRYDTLGWRVWPTWVALTLGLTFSSIGVVMVALVTAYALCRRGIRAAALVASVPTAVYLVWFAFFGRYNFGNGPQVSLSATLQLLPSFVWTALTHSWEQVSGIPASGAVLVLALLAATVVLAAPEHARQLSWAGVIAAFILAGMSGIGRAAMGLEQSRASRYVYILVTLMAPALAVVLNAAADRLRRPRFAAAVLGVGVLSLVVLNGVHSAAGFRDGRLVIFEGLKDRVLASALLLREGQVILHPLPEGQYNPDITTDVLGSGGIARELPDLEPSAQGMLDAAANLQVVVTPEQVALPAPDRVTLLEGFSGEPNPTTGCHAYFATATRPTIQMDPGPGGAKIAVSSDSTQMQTQLKRGSMVSDMVSWTTTAGIPQNVGTSVSDAALLLTLDHGGPITVCM